MTAAYEAAIANWFSDPDAFPGALLPGFTKELEPATARTRTSAGPTTPSAARGGTCSHAWSSCTAASSRSTT